MLLFGPKALLFLTALIITSASDKNTTTECRDEKFACTRLYSVHRPVKQCVHQVCFT
uniref:Microfibril associated protein 5 n=1 Tax=Ictidomys tridecemlineatus TaxID=43179 RepID=A0A287DGD5_ICTTR